MTRKWLFCLWCVLIGGIASVAILPARCSVYLCLRCYDSSRWLHFLSYAIVAAIPIGSFRYLSRMLVPLSVVALTVSIEFLRGEIPVTPARPQNVSADLFGIAAGVLFALNIRSMHRSASISEYSSADASASISSEGERPFKAVSEFTKVAGLIKE